MPHHGYPVALPPEIASTWHDQIGEIDISSSEDEKARAWRDFISISTDEIARTWRDTTDQTEEIGISSSEHNINNISISENENARTWQNYICEIDEIGISSSM